eukprot:TRINITY_DN5127_c0_g1_i2.p1 TRINITY_DN5127_c0_g1~~TRINITY_DN5127_c0_g1_i2.p1  ORF type:complete len:223 (-),score=44.07 TRINITY_DN5127_c0_g1_i2:344-913(-)
MICMGLGGRASEEVILGTISTGAQNDLEKITEMAYSKVAVYGMSKEVGLVSFPHNENRFNKPYSEDTAKRIDREVKELIDSAYQRTMNLIKDKKDLVTNLAETLLQKEVLGSEQLEGILGPRPYKTEVLRNIDRFRQGFGKDNEALEENQQAQLEETIQKDEPQQDGNDETDDSQITLPQEKKETIVAS